MAKEMWRAYAEYDDGSEVDEFVPYTAHGNYSRECEEQYDLECWLIEVMGVKRGRNCTYYSVGYYGEVEE